MAQSVTWIDPQTALPAPETALREPDGLVAVGTDLTVPRLIEAYRQGIFPWFNPGDPVLWWSPDPRMVLDTANMYRSGSLRKALRQIDRAHQRGDYERLVTTDLAFDDVIAGCAQRGSDQPQSTWITESMMQVYRRWHRLGQVHSVEVWRGDALVGGIYGVCLGRMFFGESMFTRASNASKIALAHLVAFLRCRGVQWIDCQMQTEHLAWLGATAITRDRFLNHVRQAVNAPPIEWPAGWLTSCGAVRALPANRLVFAAASIGYDQAS